MEKGRKRLSRLDWKERKLELFICHVARRPGAASTSRRGSGSTSIDLAVVQTLKVAATQEVG